MIKLLKNIWHRLFNKLWNPKGVPLCTLCGRKMTYLSYGYQGILHDITEGWACYNCALLKILTKR